MPGGFVFAKRKGNFVEKSLLPPSRRPGKIIFRPFVTRTYVESIITGLDSFRSSVYLENRSVVWRKRGREPSSRFWSVRRPDVICEFAVCGRDVDNSARVPIDYRRRRLGRMITTTVTGNRWIP